MPDGYPRPSWDEFVAQFGLRWKQGEHVFISGQTGGGKTELELKLLRLPWRMDPNRPKYSVVFVSKPKDAIFRSAHSRGFRRLREFTPRLGDSQILLGPRNHQSTGETVAEQYRVFSTALDRIYHQRGWTIGVDELAYMSERMRLGAQIADAHHMGRALGLTYVTATQRPKRIPVIVPQSASHAFIGKTSRKDDLATLAELGGDVVATRAAIMSLRDQHDFVYVDTQGILPLMVVNTRRANGQA